MACAFTVVGAASLISALAAPLAVEAGEAAALFPPWWSAAAAFAAAGTAGAVVRAGALSTVIIVHSDVAGLRARLKQAGALLVLDPLTSGLCGTADKQGNAHG